MIQFRHKGFFSRALLVLKKYNLKILKNIWNCFTLYIKKNFSSVFSIFINHSTHSSVQNIKKRRNVLLSGCCNQVNYNRGCRKSVGCFDVSSASLFNKTQKNRKNERKEWYLGRKHLSYKN